MKETFEMVAKTMQGLEEVLAEELRNLGAENVMPGRRMVSFEGDLEMLYKANLCLRTALRILKPIYKFRASDPDYLYEAVKEFDWGSILTLDKTFCIDTVAYGEEFSHSRYATYRVKDGIVDWFRDRYGEDKRPNVRIDNADISINVHIAGDEVTISLDSSGESLHKRGYRVAQTEAPINEVLAAGIILMSGWRGESPLIDPMCGSGTFLIEAALIAANINPGIYRKSFAFENWPDYDAELFDRLYNDDSQEREVNVKILGADINANAIAIATANAKSAGVLKYINLEVKDIATWTEAPEGGVLITNPPYGERISVEDMEGLYETIGNKLKNVFKGYHAWIIGYRQEYFDAIHLSASQKISLLNGSLECELREYIMFEGGYREFRKQGGRIHFGDDANARRAGYAKRRHFDDDERDERPRKERFADHKSRRDMDDTPKSDRFGDRRRKEGKGERFGKSGGKPGKFGKRADDRRAPRDERFAPRVERPRDSENPESVPHTPLAMKSFTPKRPSLAPNIRRKKKDPDQGES